MSRIVIGVEDYYDLAKTIAKISRITKNSLSTIKSNIENNKPVYDVKLFYNDHDEVSNNLINLIKDCISIQTKIGIFEIEENEDFKNFENYKNDKITPIELLNILQKHDEEIERQQRIW